MLIPQAWNVFCGLWSGHYHKLQFYTAGLKTGGGGENIVKPNSDRTAIVTDSMFALKLL